MVIDDITVGSSVVETGPQPEWRENLSVELSSLDELRAELYSHSETELQGETRAEIYQVERIITHPEFGP